LGGNETRTPPAPFEQRKTLTASMSAAGTLATRGNFQRGGKRGKKENKVCKLRKKKKKKKAPGGTDDGGRERAHVRQACPKEGKEIGRNRGREARGS